jgi:branched-chain amino acid transport system ATP-binding protein
MPMNEPSAQPPVLEVERLSAWYDECHILHGIDFNVRKGEVVTLLGRNGAGKSTTMKCLIGMVRRRSGSARFQGTETVGLPSHKIARLGVAFCPEDRGIFASLSVAENLDLPPQVLPDGMSKAEIFELFPNLSERATSRGTRLSGGEQQMLAIGRILRTGARFLLLDEPTEGLAPVIVQYIGRTIRRLKASGFTILLVEQNFRFAQTVADRHYVLESGKMVDELTREEAATQKERLTRYLGV